MSEEQKLILKMLSEGRITVDEANDLLNALKAKGEHEGASEDDESKKKEGLKERLRANEERLRAAFEQRIKAMEERMQRMREKLGRDADAEGEHVDADRLGKDMSDKVAQSLRNIAEIVSEAVPEVVEFVESAVPDMSEIFSHQTFRGGGDFPEKYEATFEHTFAIEPGGRVIIQNSRGNTRVGPLKKTDSVSAPEQCADAPDAGEQRNGGQVIIAGKKVVRAKSIEAANAYADLIEIDVTAHIPTSDACPPDGETTDADVSGETEEAAGSSLSVKSVFPDESKAQAADLPGLAAAIGEAWVDFEVSVPPKTNLSVANSRGDVDVEGINGGVQILNEKGGICVTNVAGDVKATNSRGEATASDIAGNVEIKNSRGSAHIADVRGSVCVNNGRGSLTVTNVAGDVTTDNNRGSTLVSDVAGTVGLSTSRGEAKIERVSGSVAVRNARGSVAVNDIAGDLAVSNSDGSIIVGNVSGATAITNARGPAMAQNIGGDLAIGADGDITVNEVGQNLEIVNRRGQISVASVAGSVRVHNRKGDITVQQVRGALEVGADNGDIMTNLCEDVKDPCRIQTNCGSIALHVPEQAAIDLSCETIKGNIVCDRKIGEVIERDGGSSLEAKLNNGGPQVVIAAMRGDIRIS